MRIHGSRIHSQIRRAWPGVTQPIARVEARYVGNGRESSRALRHGDSVWASRESPSKCVERSRVDRVFAIVGGRSDNITIEKDGEASVRQIKCLGEGE
jgi:hypothetical protein